MSSEPVCLVTLSWNRKEDTLACLASALAMDPPVSHVILVDNASTDGTSQAVADRFPQAQVLINAENLGFAGGMNVGLRAALNRGAGYVLLINNDTLLALDLLGVLLAVAEEDPRVGMVTPKIYYADPPDRVWYAGAMRRRWLPGQAFPGYGRRDAPRYDRRRDVDYVTGCGLLVRASVLRQVGLFDEVTFFMYHEDLDLSERVRRAGYRIVYAPQAHMWHKESASTAPLSPRRWYYLGRYIVPFYWRYYRRPGPSVVLYALYVALREMAKGHPRAVMPFLEGIHDGLRVMRGAERRAAGPMASVG
jgi:GT2 family glycosyltransferase